VYLANTILPRYLFPTVLAAMPLSDEDVKLLATADQSMADEVVDLIARAEQALSTEGEGKAAARALMIQAIQRVIPEGQDIQSTDIYRQKVWKSILVMIPDAPPPPSKRAAWAELADVWKSRCWNHVSPAVLGPGEGKQPGQAWDARAFDIAPWTRSKSALRLVMSPDGSLVSYFGGDPAPYGVGTSKVWVYSTAPWAGVHAIDSDALDVAFSPRGLLSYGGFNKAVVTYDTTTWAHVNTIEAGFRVYTVAYSASGAQLTFGGLQGENVYVHDATSFERLHAIPADHWTTTSLVYAPNDAFLAYWGGGEYGVSGVTLNPSQGVYVLSTESWQLVHFEPCINGFAQMEFSPASDALTFPRTADGTISSPALSGGNLHLLTLSTADWTVASQLAWEHPGCVRFALSADGSHLARTDGLCVHVIDLQSSVEVYKLEFCGPDYPGSDTAAHALLWLPDGQLVVGMPGRSTEEALDETTNGNGPPPARLYTVATQIDRVMATAPCALL